MAEDGKTVEKIVLELETNWDRVLGGELAKYTTFVQKVGGISRSFEKNFTNLGNTVATNMKNMFGKTATGVKATMGQSRAIMRQVANQGIRVNEQYLKSFEQLEKAQKNFNTELDKLARKAKTIEKLRQTAETPKSKEMHDKELERLRDRGRALVQQLQAQGVQVQDQLSKQLGSLARQTSRGFVKTALGNLESVRGVVKDIGSQLKIVKNQMGMQTDINKIFKVEGVFNDMKTQYTALQKTLRNQSKLTADAEKEVRNALFAYRTASDEKIKAKNLQAYKETIRNLIDIKRHYRDLEDEVNQYGKSVDGVQDDLKKMANTLRQSISKGIRPSDMTKRMTKAMDTLVDYARNTGRGMGQALQKSLSQGRDLEQALNKDIQKLKEMREQAVQLQKTGVIDARSEINRIDAVMKRYNQFIAEYKKQQRSVQNILGQRKGKNINTGTVELKDIIDTYNKLGNEVKKFGRVQEKNLFEAQEKVKQLDTLWNKYLAKRKSVNEKLKQIQSELHKVDIAMSKTTNVQLLAEYEKYRKVLVAKMKGVEAVLGKAFIPPAIIRSKYKEIERAAASAQDTIRDKFLRNNNYVEQSFKSISEEYSKLTNKVERLSNKRFVSKTAIEQAKKGLVDIKEKAAKYEAQILEIQNAIRKLEQLQRKGLGAPGIQAQTEKLRENVAQMRKYTQQMNVYSTQAQRNIDRLQKRSLKSVLTGGWEMIRNFRWQVAAVIYLIQRAVFAVQRVFFSIVNEAMQFQKNAMSIAASVSYAMVGNIEKSYQRAYGFSRNLMTALEMEAARTILTLEDMMMLTKTFAQAGIIPDTRADVKKISTIGTAIKALTEGMANAGTQMRQELYAVIAGRQRATDQLQMMFKMIGIDIQRTIDSAKKEGKSMIDALSTALAPFNEMNRMMENSYATVVNKLKVIWGIIKRLGAEPVMEKLADGFQRFADTLYNAHTEVLTPLGEDFVQTLRAGLTFLMEIGKSLWNVIKAVGKTFGVIFGLVNDIISVFMTWGGETEIIDSRLAGLVGLMKAVMGITAVIEVMFVSIHKIARAIFNTTRMFVLGMANAIAALGLAIAGEYEAAGKRLDNIKGLFTDFTSGWSDVFDIPDSVSNRIDDLQDSFSRIHDSVNNISHSLDGLGERFVLPYKIENLGRSLEKIGKQITELERAALEGPAKFQFDFETAINNNKELYDQLSLNIEAVKLHRLALMGTANDLTVGQKQAWDSVIVHWKEGLAYIERLNEAAKKKRDKQTADWYAKQAKQFAQMQRQAATFMIEISNRPESLEEKTDRWYETMKARLEELKVTNKIVAQNLDEFRQALEEGLERRREQDAEKISQEFAKFEKQITSHRVLNAYEKIDLELIKISAEIQKSNDLTIRQKALLEGVLGVAKMERKEMVALQQAYQAHMKQMDVYSAKAAYMQDSFSPATQRKGQMLELQVNYEKAITDIEKEYRRVLAQWQDEPGVWKENSKHAQAYAEALMESYRQIGISLKRDVWRVQNPLWNDMIEMSKNWADGLSDSLTDLILDFENFGESIKSLWESIVRDMLKATIKRKMIEPLMGALGSGESGSPTPFQRMKGTASTVAASTANQMSKAAEKSGALEAMINSGKPIPVYIVQTPDLENVSQSVNEATQAINQKGQDTVRAVDTGNQAQQNLLMQLVTKSYGQTHDAVKGVGDWVGSLFGGSGGGNNAGLMPGESPTENSARLGMIGGSLMMAEGGTIAEHVVGQGLKSGQIYEFGEKSKYGEFEDVIPRKKMPMRGSGTSIQLSMPLNISAIDTQSGVDFIIRNQKVIETNMMRSMRNNKAIRGLITQSR